MIIPRCIVDMEAKRCFGFVERVSVILYILLMDGRDVRGF